MLLIGLLSLKGNAQDSIRNQDITLLSDTDPSFIKSFSRSNDFRIIGGGLGHVLNYQSSNEQNQRLNLDTYTNVALLTGFGLTYKFIDFDLTFTVKSFQPTNNDIGNLDQFRLLASYTARSNSFRLYVSDSKGVISTNPETDFQSNPSIRLTKWTGQITHIFNYKRFSYRAANFQSELQTKSAGSFLLRFEPFYRELGIQGVALAPDTYDIKAAFEKQAGLDYVNAPGMLLLPGYAYTAVLKDGRYYLSPMILLGTGFAVNTYRSNEGKFNTLNWEYSGALSINTGYNGSLIYTNLRLSSDITYSYLNPSYFTTNELKIFLTLGYRFKHLENLIPVSLL